MSSSTSAFSFWQSLHSSSFGSFVFKSLSSESSLGSLILLNSLPGLCVSNGKAQKHHDSCRLFLRINGFIVCIAIDGVYVSDDFGKLATSKFQFTQVVCHYCDAFLYSF